MYTAKFSEILLCGILQHVILPNYPRFALHKLSDKHGMPTKVEDNVYLPGNIQCSIDKLSINGCYLYENGSCLHIFIGPNISQDLLFHIFGVSTIEEIQGVSMEQDLGSRVRPLSS